MGWAVVLDPYVADLADNNVVCQKIVSTVYYSADHAFVVDKGQVLLERYEQLARSKPEGWVRQVYKYLVESQRSANSSTAHILCLELPPMPKGAYCCDSDADRVEGIDQVERIMVGLASGQQNTALVTLDSASRSQCQSQWLFWTDECYQKVLNQHKVCFKFTDSWDWLNEPYPPCPNTKQSLEEFLRTHGGGEIRETQQLEFKCPDNPANGLTNKLVEEIREAICAMANSDGGYVFIGVKDDGSIPGVALLYDGKPRSVDELSRILYREHHQFEPDEPVDALWEIKVETDRYTFVFRIPKRRIKNYTYKGKMFIRIGTQSLQR